MGHQKIQKKYWLPPVFYWTSGKSKWIVDHTCMIHPGDLRLADGRNVRGKSKW
jgi:hypothetical protein